MAISDLLCDYFKCHESHCSLEVSAEPVGEPGYFRFGSDIRCYGRPCVDKASADVTARLYDVAQAIRYESSRCLIPFDPSDVVEKLRRERYVSHQSCSKGRAVGSLARKSYYFLRPLLPTPVRRYPQRFVLRGWRKRSFPAWPVDRTVDKILQKLMHLALQSGSWREIPFVWFWPLGKSACVVMTHDVETSSGLQFCPSLMDINDAYGIKASFQLIPGARYTISTEIVQNIKSRQHEVNVHDWNHDGQLFSDYNLFSQRAASINRSAKNFGAVGFRSGCLYRNTDWYKLLEFDYDMSIPNVGHLDPQPGGCCTVMPYFVGKMLEIPVTMTQDYSLFHILGDYSIDLWRRQLELILESNGLANFIVHPDYILKKRARATYVTLLEYLSQLRDERNIWLPRPEQVNCWWRARREMKLVRDGSDWRIEGPQKEQACLAYAYLDGERLSYRLARYRDEIVQRR